MADALPSSKIDLTVSEEDPQTLILNYPTSLTTHAGNYLADKVKLEFGARSDHLPPETRLVKPYAAEQLPALFEEPDVEVKVLSAARTFWEKATILHMLFYQKPNKALGRAMSRHYYDLATLAGTPIKAEALDDLDLLKAVARHKSSLSSGVGEL
nr:nucleotidyl transferase AbiEii/AbiGii toxin family protein [Algimonas ampicilliniresistens]